MMGKELTHIVLAKFKEEVSEEKIEECIKYFANYCHRVPSVKAVKWYLTYSLNSYFFFSNFL